MLGNSNSSSQDKENKQHYKSHKYYLAVLVEQNIPLGTWDCKLYLQVEDNCYLNKMSN
jgi:hypothetical protein